MMRSWLFSFLLLWSLSCTNDWDDGLSNPSPIQRCIVGKVESCACPGSNVQGAQTCQEDGSFGVCLGCPGDESTGGNSSTGGDAGAGGDAGGNPFGGGGDPFGGGGDPFGEGGKPQGGSNQGGTSGQGNAGGSIPGDQDGDGWTVAQGDCNDADPKINPGAVEVLEVDLVGKPLPASKQIDNDCDGKILQPGMPTSCDAGLGAVLNDPFDAARAVGLCRIKVTEASKKWGVIDAQLSDIAGPMFSGNIKAKGKGLEHAFGILPGFGVTSPPREGQRVLALSSGIARAPGQPGWGEADVCSYNKGYTSGFPPGFPKQGTCGVTGTPNDGVAIDFKIRVPTNAKSLKFKYRFFGCDYPGYLCSTLNDVFAVLMSPSPLVAGDPMADSQNQSANIVFELLGGGVKNVIGINDKSFMTACEPENTGYPNCKQGNGQQLKGSGFEGHGASSWIIDQTNVPPGEVISLRIAIWDSGDGILDSTAILDAFEWSTQAVNGATNQIDPVVFPVGGAGGSGQGGSPNPFGGSSGGGGTGSNSGGSGGGSATVGPCPDGTCAGPDQCCLGDGACGTLVMGMFCM